MIDLTSIKKVHCIGIGGIGLSAAARLLLARGITVMGSDDHESEVTRKLQEIGVSVVFGEHPEVIDESVDLIVFSVAVPKTHPERVRAGELGIAAVTYPQLLGALLEGKYGIGVSGTNGKTTTTAMLGLIALRAQLDPTIIVGSNLNYLDGNARVGGSNYFIFESDEYQRAFENYHPQMVALTYITADHLDCYKDIEDIKLTFKKYISKVPEDGVVIINADDANSVEMAQDSIARKVTYGISAAADVQARDIVIDAGKQIFEVVYKGVALGKVSLQLPARYNVYNALAAITSALELGIDFSVIATALGEYTGSWRRFEQLGMSGATRVVADYAHTPDAVAATIVAAKEFYPRKKILTVFQPHHYHRTESLFSEFSQAFGAADLAIITDIFQVTGREQSENQKITSADLVEAAHQRGANVVYGGNLAETESKVRELIPEYDVVLCMGAGSIYDLAKKLV
jgi:UDP-N-acetylmuramate--alanine ligase